MIRMTPSTLQGARAMVLMSRCKPASHCRNGLELSGSLKRTTIYGLVMHIVPHFQRPFCEHAHGMRMEE